MAFTEHASKKYVDERDALLATKNALAAEAQERERLANIVAQNRRDTYSKDEVNRIVEALRGARFEKVQALPELADADPLVIYLLPRTSPETDNRYDEYIVVIDGEGARSWDKLGSTDIDLSGYATTEYVANNYATKQECSNAQQTADDAQSAAETAQQTADDAQSAAETAQRTANGKQDALTQEQLDAIDDVKNKLDKSNGTADGLVMKSGSYALKFDTFSGTIPRLVVGTVDAQTGVISWGGSYFLSSSAIGAIVQTDTLNDAVAKRLGIGNIYRLVGKTSGGADCNLVWYNMQTGSTVGNVLGFTVDGVAKTVKSVYITASPSFPDVAASVTDSNNVSYDFSGTAETLNLHEVATRGECSAKRDWTDVSAGTRILKWTQQGDTQYPEYVYSDAAGAWVNSHGDKIVGPRLVEAYRQDGDTFYRDKETGEAPVYSWYGSDGSLIGSASAGQLDCTISIGWSPWNVRFTVGNDKVAADRFAFESEVGGLSEEVEQKRDKTDNFTIYGDAAYKTWEVSGGSGDNEAIYSRGTYTYDAESGTWVRDSFRAIRRKSGTANTFQLVANPGQQAEGVMAEFDGFGPHSVDMDYAGMQSTGVSIGSSAADALARDSDVKNNANAIEYLRRMFSGQTLPQHPTQNQIAEVVKTIFTQLGGTIV